MDWTIIIDCRASEEVNMVFEFENWYNNPFTKEGNKMVKIKCIGRAWIGHRKKIIYDCQEIRRGKNKGKFKVKHLVGTHTEGVNKGKFRYTQTVVLPDELILNSKEEI